MFSFWKKNKKQDNTWKEEEIIIIDESKNQDNIEETLSIKENDKVILAEPKIINNTDWNKWEPDEGNNKWQKAEIIEEAKEVKEKIDTKKELEEKAKKENLEKIKKIWLHKEETEEKPVIVNEDETKDETKIRLEKEKKKKKEKILENITSYKDAIKAIDFFEATEEWKKAYKAIEEVKEKEKEAFEEVIKSIDWNDNINNKEWLKQTKLFKSRIELLNKRKTKIEKDEIKFRKKEEIKRFKIRFKQIKSKINLLIKSNNNSDAMNLLSAFLDENKDKNIVIRFYNTERKKVLKNVDKERRKEEAKMWKSAKTEAYKLIWNTFEEVQEIKDSKGQSSWIFAKIKEKLNFYKRVKENLRKKRLLDEVNLLIDEDDKIKNQLAKEKLQNMHKWLIKEIYNDDLEWYDLYWKILWADKISWDTFWFNEWKDKYTFFIWDATGHGIRAWFIVTLLSRTFDSLVNKVSLKELTFEINNTLKQNLKNKNFITWIIFQTKKKNLNKVKIAWMGHEPILIYRDETKTTERLTPWWLAAWIRLMENQDSIKEKDIILKKNDIIFTYSDWITECRNENWEMYSLEKLELIINKVASISTDPKKIYEQIIADLKIFQWWTSFNDDASIIVIRRNTDKDKLSKDDKYLAEIAEKQNLEKKDVKNLEWKNKTEIELELERIRKDRDLKSIVKSLDNLYITWEILKLKQESIRFIKKGYIDKRINAYLKRAIDNETKYKIDLKNQRISNKFTVLSQLLKKWDYDTVIKESSEIISKEWVL